uniref:Uncharacterized protein n=1 Tax=Cacopsylla melanoneura TaxID=428564 RepID=A0A8D8WKJ5_9HEMI
MTVTIVTMQTRLWRRVLEMKMRTTGPRTWYSSSRVRRRPAPRTSCGTRESSRSQAAEKCTVKVGVNPRAVNLATMEDQEEGEGGRLATSHRSAEPRVGTSGSCGPNFTHNVWSNQRNSRQCRTATAQPR